MASPPRRSLRCVRREQRGQERVELTSSRIHGKGVRGLEMSRAGIRVEVDQDVTGERKQQEWWLEQHQRVTLIIIYNSIFKENTHPSPGPNPTVVAMSVLGNINFAWAVTDEKKKQKKQHTHTHRVTGQKDGGWRNNEEAAEWWGWGQAPVMWPPVPPLTPVEMRMGGSPSSGIKLRELPTGLPTGATGVWAAWGGRRDGC